METKHTSGSWYVAEDQSNDHSGNRVIIRTDKGNHPQVAVAINYNTEANEANAKLMATAPVLLNELSNLIEACLLKVETREIRNDLLSAQHAVSMAKGNIKPYHPKSTK